MITEQPPQNIDTIDSKVSKFPKDASESSTSPVNIDLKIKIEDIKAQLTTTINAAFMREDLSEKEQNDIIKKGKVESYCQLTVLYYQNNMYPKALAYASALHQIDANNPVFTYTLASILNKLNMGRIATTLGLSLIKSDPNNHEYHAILATSYSLINRYTEALKYQKKADLLLPNKFEYKASLGLIYKKLGEATQSISYYEQALAINPNSASVNIALAEVYFEKRNIIMARQYSKAALSLSPHNRFIQAKSREIIGKS